MMKMIIGREKMGTSTVTPLELIMSDINALKKGSTNTQPTGMEIYEL